MKFTKIVKSLDKKLQYNILIEDIKQSIEKAIEKYSYRDIFSSEEISNAINEATSRIK